MSRSAKSPRPTKPKRNAALLTHAHPHAMEGRRRIADAKGVRFARLLGKATKVFGDLESAKRWLTTPQFGLDGVVPLDYAKTEIGARQVEKLLGRIEHGVYS